MKKDKRRTAEQVLLEQVMAFGFEKCEFRCLPNPFCRQTSGLKPEPAEKDSLGLIKTPWLCEVQLLDRD